MMLAVNRAAPSRDRSPVHQAAEAIAPRVLLVTGAYYPEISAAAVQCRTVAAALRGRVSFGVLTTAVARSLAPIETVDGVPVRRVLIDVGSRLSKAAASFGLVRQMLAASRNYDLIHVHGFSQKNIPVALLATMLRKPVVLTAHTAGQDEPDAVARRGRLARWAFRSAALVLCVSPDLEARCRAALDRGRVRLSPNGVDTTRFRPAGHVERAALRRALGWPDDQPVVLFVGFFSRDKRPDLLFRAWRRLSPSVRARLVFVGATAASYYEIDRSIAASIRDEAAALGRSESVTFVEPTHAIEQYFRAGDVFVLSSVREAQPLALVEAMACGLPCIATRLRGATDALIEDGVNGRLIAADDEAMLAAALRELLTDSAAAQSLGARARATVIERYDIRATAEHWLEAYKTVLSEK